MDPQKYSRPIDSLDISNHTSPCQCSLSKVVFFPSFIFSADKTGLKIGRVVFFNGIHHISWEKLLEVETGEIGLPRWGRAYRPGNPIQFPAMKLVFDTSVSLGDFWGHHFARPYKDRQFLIAEKLLGCSLPEAIASMRRMQQRYSK